MTIEVYGMPLSAPARIVYMTCEMLNLDYKVHTVNIMAGENKTPEYLKINPQHNIPAMVDGDLKMNESRAIAAYLASEYGPDDSPLYPKCQKARAIVDQRMYFDMGSFYQAFSECIYPVVFHGKEKMEQAKLERFDEVLGWVTDFVTPTGFAAGTTVPTLADVCFTATLSSIAASGLVDDCETKHPKLYAYLEKMKTLIPNYDKCNGEGADKFGELVKDKIAAAKKA